MNENEKQIIAIGKVYEAVKDLSPESAGNVLQYVASMVLPKLKIQNSLAIEPKQSQSAQVDIPINTNLSSIAEKWMLRNKINEEMLSNIYSLGLEEIDLILDSVPGKNKKERIRSIFLLKGMCEYLKTGVAKFTHEAVKQTALHYDAWDTDNFSNHLKSFQIEVSGSKANDYTLSAKGITSGTELIKNLLLN